MSFFFFSGMGDGETISMRVLSVYSGEFSCLSYPCENTAASLLWLVTLHYVFSFSDPIGCEGGEGAGLEYEEKHVLCTVEHPWIQTSNSAVTI